MPERLLLCTDLDRTLIPNGPQPESPGARAHFATLAAEQLVARDVKLLPGDVPQRDVNGA